MHDNDAYADMKKAGYRRPLTGYVPIHMPKNTWAGPVIPAISFVMAFGIIWHMWLLVGVSFVAMIAVTIYHTFNYKRDNYIPADQVIRTEEEHNRMLEAHV